MLRDQGYLQLVFASVLMFYAGFLSGMPIASAAPRDEESCQRLKTEKEALTVLGIDTYFERGAEWVKANLTAADYNLVKRYVNVYEQLKFRCPAEDVKGVKAKAYKGAVPPMPVRSPKRGERTATPAKTDTPG